MVFVEADDELHEEEEDQKEECKLKGTAAFSFGRNVSENSTWSTRKETTRFESTAILGAATVIDGIEFIDAWFCGWVDLEGNR